MTSHLIRWTGEFSGHWSQFLDVAGAPNTFHSFIDVAVFYSLHRFVLAKIASEYVQYLKKDHIKEDSAFVREYFKQDDLDPEVPIRRVTLLDIAVHPSCPGSEMAQILLEHGADPNELSGYERRPVWEHVLNRAQASLKQGFGEDKWLHIIKVFLQYYVDLRGYATDADEDRRRMLGLIDGFRAKHRAEVASLRLRVEKKLPGKKRDKIKLWASEKLGSRKSSGHQGRYLN